MSAHTPGPWIASDFGSDDPDEPLAIWRDDGRSDFYLRTERVATCDFDDEDGPHIIAARANARLIAAAPELLAALQQARAWTAAIGDDTEWKHDQLDRLDAAIAKAKQP